MAGKSNTVRIAAALALALVPTVAVAQDKNTVPLRHSPKAGALLIEVQVNGRPRTFILDTGAQNCIIDLRSVGFLTLADLNSAFVKDGVSGGKKGAVFILLSLRVGGKEFREWEAMATDLRNMEKDFGTRVDGILALDFLAKFARVTLDFEHMTVEIGITTALTRSSRGVIYFRQP
jgi:predicted aspartyl protease